MNFHILAKKNFGPGVNKHSARGDEISDANDKRPLRMSITFVQKQVCAMWQ